MFMKTNYKEWLIQRSLAECNKILNEVGEESVPKLALKVSNNISADLMRHYQKEVGIQARYGGIRNPAMVLCNKIRHEFTNYDRIRDALTDAVRSDGIDECRELEIRAQLTKNVSNLVVSIIDNISFPISVSGQAIQKNELVSANTRYTIKEMGNITGTMQQYRCNKTTVRQDVRRPNLVKV